MPPTEEQEDRLQELILLASSHEAGSAAALCSCVSAAVLSAPLALLLTVFQGSSCACGHTCWTTVARARQISIIRGSSSVYGNGLAPVVPDQRRGGVRAALGCALGFAGGTSTGSETVRFAGVAFLLQASRLAVSNVLTLTPSLQHFKCRDVLASSHDLWETNA